MDAVWPGTYVEESNLAQNVFLLRKKLGQAPDGGEYIETLSKRGYRMNVPVQEIELPAEKLPDEKPLAVGTTGEAGAIVTHARNYRGLVTGASVLAAMTVAALVSRFFPSPSESVPVTGNFVQITHDTKDKRGKTGAFGGPDAALLTDGSRLYFTSGHLLLPASGKSLQLAASRPKCQFRSLSRNCSISRLPGPNCLSRVRWMMLRRGRSGPCQYRPEYRATSAVSRLAMPRGRPTDTRLHLHVGLSSACRMSTEPTSEN